MSSTFHPFPRLPVELRLAIWQLTTPQTSQVLKLSNLGTPSKSPATRFILSLFLACKESQLEVLSVYTRVYSRGIAESRQFSLINLSRDYLDLDLLIRSTNRDGTQLLLPKRLCDTAVTLNSMNRSIRRFLELRGGNYPSLESLLLVVHKHRSGQGSGLAYIMSSQRQEYLRFLKAVIVREFAAIETTGGTNTGVSCVMPKLMFDIEKMVSDGYESHKNRNAVDLRRIPDDENTADLIVKWPLGTSYVARAVPELDTLEITPASA